MPYKPKFCCECGEPIERTDWTFFTSRRFCELCATDYKLADWIPRTVIAASVLLGIFGFGALLRKPEKALNLASGITANINRSAVNTPAGANDQSTAKTPEANSNVEHTSSKPSNVLPKPISNIQKVENRANAPREETIYFCGAETKKGTPCTRRVKGGGRCWQHVGKTAMLPTEKLVASR